MIVEAESKEEKLELLDIIKRGSVVTWHHINFHGEYDFSEKKFKNTMKFIYEELRKLNI